MPPRPGQLRSAVANCPCCGYRTLSGRGDFEVCVLCDWEDDGQGDADADDVRGGPNAHFSLTMARNNFRANLTMYPTDEDSRIRFVNSVLEEHAKRSIMSALEKMTGTETGEAAGLWVQIEDAERVLQTESERRIAESEKRAGA